MTARDLVAKCRLGWIQRNETSTPDMESLSFVFLIPPEYRGEFSGGKEHYGVSIAINTGEGFDTSLFNLTRVISMKMTVAGEHAVREIEKCQSEAR